ncbi:MAG: polysaccharide pyruvyl transferase family protein [Clostridium septicum]|uniref:polysaccharide pyruvyl transferase family protein n=1 Tax=Clostridium septicum TaxID=1504 RepID=UPI002588D97C|nr:polysaccharide pyruvyl transferase family protein [Clostridium septicum]MDU1312963.1 polysaccharide pyruvyl transferase family protein [Clostridium septicum]
MKIVILGASLVSGNKGVNALTRGTINSIISKDSNCTIEIVSYSSNKELIHEIDGKEIKEIPFYAKKRLVDCVLILFKLKKIESLKCNKAIESILNADYILDISEGDSFSDIYGIKRFILHSIGKYFSIKGNKKLIIMPQTIGPFKNKIVNNIAKYLLKNSEYIFTRDNLSYKVVEDMNLNKEIKCLPDMAFYMTPKENNVYNYVFEDNKNIIGLNVSALLYNGGYNKSNMFNFKSDFISIIDKLIKKIMEDSNNTILLVPHVITPIEVENDLEVCRAIEEKYSKIYPNRIIAIKEEFAEDELKYVISKCNLFIGGRMHACIAGVSTNVVTMPIAYSRKFIGIWEGLGLKECVADPRIHTEDEIIEIYEYCTENKDYITNKLEEKNNEYKKYINYILDVIK